MRCLYCGKMMEANVSEIEKKNEWHSRCVQKFFGTKQLPLLDVTEQQLESLANATVNKGLTVPGVQKKLSLHLSSDAEARLTLVDYPTGYILKPQTQEYSHMPEYEALAMRLAALAGIQTVPNALIKMNDTYAYITKRIDRQFTGDRVNMYAMEDFCQLSHRLTQDKYRGSYESCGRIIKKYSVYPGLDMTELFIRVVFSFIVGNSDMHLKNFSLREQKAGSRQFVLSQAYDMLPVNVIMPEDEEEMALALNGKKRNITKKDFVLFAESCGITDKTATKMMQKLCSMKDIFLHECDLSYLSEAEKEKIKALIVARIERLS